MTITEQIAYIEYCEDNTNKLSDWECKFIDAISLRMSRGRSLTKKQINKLEDIHNRVIV